MKTAVINGSADTFFTFPDGAVGQTNDVGYREAFLYIDLDADRVGSEPGYSVTVCFCKHCLPPWNVILIFPPRKWWVYPRPISGALPIPIQRAIANRLGNMRRENRILMFQIGNSARNL